MSASSDGRLGPRIGLAEIPQQQRELVAAEPPDHVGGAHLARQHVRDRLEHLVAGGMAERIVDRLQPVDIEQDQRPARPIALDIGDRALQLVLETAAVGNAEQEIGVGGGLQLLDPLQRGA